MRKTAILLPIQQIAALEMSRDTVASEKSLIDK